MNGVNQRECKIQISYPGIEIYIDNAQDVELAKPNLRYMLNDMRSKNHNYELNICTSYLEWEKDITYNEEGDNFNIYDREWRDFYGEPYDSKECLDELFSIITDWITD